MVPIGFVFNFIVSDVGADCSVRCDDNDTTTFSGVLDLVEDGIDR